MYRSAAIAVGIGTAAPTGITASAPTVNRLLLLTANLS